jgi:hypothetical protein
VTRSTLRNRLRRYWKMEAANVVLVPTIGIAAVKRAGDTIDLPMVIAACAASSLLLVGTFALRAHYRMSLADGRSMATFAPVASRLQTPMAFFAAAAVLCAGYAVFRIEGFSPSAIATCVFALLAALEYVNYFVVQLQHFDHGPDFRRMIAGKGFRPSHLARTIKRYRASTAKQQL